MRRDVRTQRKVRLWRAVVGGVCSSVDLKRSVVALESPVGELDSGNWERDGLELLIGEANVAKCKAT